MRAYIQLSGVIFALVAIVHLVRVLARWPLLIAGYPLPAVASLFVLVVSAGMSAWAWRLLTGQAGTGEAARRPPGA